MGAWIEIREEVEKYPSEKVAPLVGAWIEMVGRWIFLPPLLTVAPLVGAWIEIRKNSRQQLHLTSLLSWERGLKYYAPCLISAGGASLLSWARGLKLINQVTVLSEKSSLLSWERGLKCLFLLW